jgi:hypothetical protein
VRLAWLATLTACGRLDFGAPGVDAPSVDAPVDAIPTCASWGPFGSVQSFPELAGMVIADPMPRADRLELFFTRNDSGFWRVLQTERDTLGAAFSTPVDDAALSSDTGNSQDPSLSADGLTVYLMSDRSGAYQVYEAQRAHVSDTFSAPAVPSALATVTPSSLSLVPDGSSLYVETGGAVTRFAIQGGDVQAPGVAVTTPGPVIWISISAEELELFYDVGTDMFHATRASPTDAFGNEQLVDVGGMPASDAAISPDGSELWFGSSLGGLYKVTRSCQP